MEKSKGTGHRKRLWGYEGKKFGRGSARRFLAALAAAALVLSVTGCGGNGQNSGQESAGQEGGGQNTAAATAKGRYVEKTLPTPGEFHGKGQLTALSDGRIGMLDYENGVTLLSADQGETWKSEPVADLQQAIHFGKEITGAVMAPDGGFFWRELLVTGASQEKPYPERYVYLAPDGTRAEFELGLEDYQTSVQKTVFGGNGSLYAYTASGAVYEIDVQKQTAKWLFATEQFPKDVSLCTDSTGLWLQDGKKAYRYDYESGEVNTGDEVLNGFLAEQTLARTGIILCAPFGEEDNTLYLACVDGIYRHVAGGSVMEQIADGMLNRLSEVSEKPVSMLQVGKEKFVILYQDGELLSYEYDAEAPVAPAEEISVYSLYPDETLLFSVNVFREANPDVHVRLETGLSGEDGVTERDAILNLNTRLLAGEGPDLLLLDRMPADSYVEKGILADLSEVTAELKAESRYFENILEGYKQDDGIFVIPFRYSLPLLSGKTSDLEEITDLDTLASAAERLADSGEGNHTVMGTYTAEELLEKLYALCADAWVLEDGRTDEEALRQFLQDAKRIYDAEQRGLTQELIQEHLDNRAYAEGNGITEAYYYGMAFQTEKQFLGGQAIAAGYVYSMEDYRYVAAFHKAVEGYDVKKWDTQMKNVFCPEGLVGLSANAQNPEGAKRLLKTLLSVEVQRQGSGEGFPVNADAFDQFVQNPKPQFTETVSYPDEDGTMRNLELLWPDSGDIDRLKEIIRSLETPSSTDTFFREDVISIGAKALTGEKGIDESVEQIVQKISIRLQE